VNAFTAHWFDGLTSRMHAVTVSCADDGQVQVVGDGVDRREALTALRISPRLGRTPRTIVFADGARLLVADHALLDAWFPAEDRLQRLVDLLERHAHAVAASIIVSVVALVVTFVWGVPWLSDRIAMQIPASVEARLGEGVLGQLDRVFGFEPSTLDEQRQDELRARFDRLVASLPSMGEQRLLFRHAEGVGANALALPGGTIVVTDELVALFADDREFDAVVAHELGHQHDRHALRQTLRSSFVVVLAAFFAGDVSAASTVVVGVPTFLLQSHYSRGFEDDADRFAFRALAAMGESPAWFAEAMRKLDAEHADYGEDVSYLSTHPASSARIEAAEAAGAEFLIAHPEKAKDVPGYDPCAEDGACEDVEDVECSDDTCEEEGAEDRIQPLPGECTDNPDD
jgi:Zn-dependent protease with chaperone function